MEIDPALTVALQSTLTLQEVRCLAQRLLDEGKSKQVVIEQFEQARQIMREKGREADEDVICDVMDFLVGWCSPNTRLDEPSDNNGTSDPSRGAIVKGASEPS